MFSKGEKIFVALFVALIFMLALFFFVDCARC